MTLESKLSTKKGDLVSIVPLFEEGTKQHADEITAERFDNKELRDDYFYTADHAMYSVEDGEEFLYLGREETNPIFANLEEATNQLIETENYKLNGEEISKIRESDSTLRVKLSDLKLNEHGSEFSYFEINTKEFDNLNESQRNVAERVYGSGDNFSKHMGMLNESGITSTRVYVLNPKYVKENTKDGNIARACWLGSFDNDSNFNADGRNVYNNDGLRGVLSQKSAEGSALKVDYDSALNKVLSEGPRNETDAAKMLNAANNFYQKRAER